MTRNSLSELRGIVSNYRTYRRHGLRNAWQLAGMSAVLDTLLRWLGATALIVGSLYLMSDRANAISDNATGEARQTIIRQAEYILDLEAMLAKCLSGKEQQLWVGNELWFCGASPTGIMREEHHEQTL